MKEATALGVESPPRENNIGVRLTDTEKAVIAKAADYRGFRSVSKWARKTLLLGALADIRKGRVAK